jgi:hypothetical protein
MNQQPDKFFRKKLENHNIPAPPMAWNKIDAALDKKNNKGLWLKIAAGLLLLAIASVLLWNTNSKSDQQLLSEKTKKNTVVKKEAEKKETPDHDEVGKIEQKSNEKKEEIKVVSIPKKQNNQKATPAHNDFIEKETSEIKTENSLATTSPAEKENIEQLPVVTEENIKETEIAVNEKTPTQNESVTEDDGVTIVYSVEEVNKKYLNKNSLTEATSDEKKPSTLRKLLDKAYDLKHNQDPFGDLRQKKNEILALNFKSSKQRNQNK